MATAPLDQPFRVSHQGDLSGYNAENPVVASSTREARSMVVWQGTSPGLPGEWDVHGRVIDGSGAGVSADFRISNVPGTYPAPAGGFSPDVAYNHALNEYLVVWQAHVPGADTRIQAQRIGPTGNPIGPVTYVTALPGFSEEAAVVHDPERDRYLVVWSHATGSEREIYAQRLDGGLTPLGGAVRLSEMGTDGVSGFVAHQPDVAYNSATDEFLAVWHGRDVASDGSEIFGQRVSALGTPVGSDLQISDMGNGSSSHSAELGMVAANDVDNEYLVVWTGNDDAAGLAGNEFELFGQLLAADGSTLGQDDFRITHFGPDVDPAWAMCLRPSVAYSSGEDEYAVLGCGRDPDGRMQAIGQPLSADGDRLPPAGSAVSEARPGVLATGLAYSPLQDEFVATWQQPADAGSPAEAFARRLGNAAPVARFEWVPETPDIGVAACFDASSSSDSDGTIITYAWDLDGDGAYVDGTGSTICHAFLEEGDHVVGLQVTDDDGASDVERKTLSVRDRTPPTSHHECAPRPCDEWQPGPARVTITAQDAGTGVAEIHYRINDRPEVTVVGDSVEFEVGGGGANAISYYAVDRASPTPNREAPNTGTVLIDRVGPQTTVTPPVGHGVVREISGTALDDFSGVSVVTVTFVRLTGMPGAVTQRTATCTGCPIGTAVTWRVSTAGLSGGMYSATATSTDRAGNTGPPSSPPQTFMVGGGPGF